MTTVTYILRKEDTFSNLMLKRPHWNNHLSGYIWCLKEFHCREMVIAANLVEIHEHFPYQLWMTQDMSSVLCQTLLNYHSRSQILDIFSCAANHKGILYRISKHLDILKEVIHTLNFTLLRSKTGEQYL